MSADSDLVVDRLQRRFNVTAKIEGDPLPVFTAQRQNMEHANWLGSASKVSDCYLLSDGNDTYAVDVRDGQSCGIRRFSQANPVMDCLEEAKRANLIGPGTEVRILNLPSVHMEVLWLRTDGADTFMPYNRGKAGDPPAYTVDPDFVQTVQARAQDGRKAYEVWAARAVVGGNPDPANA